MSWFRVDDQFHGHAKVLELLNHRDGHKALALWLLAGSWASRMSKDGVVPRSALRLWRVTKNQAGILVKVGLWEVVDGGWKFHDWTDYRASGGMETQGRDVEGWVYAIQAIDGGPIKVGFSTNPWARLAALQTANPLELRILAKVKGTKVLEFEILKSLEAHQVQGEWIDDTPETRSVLSSYGLTIPVATNVSYGRPATIPVPSRPEPVPFPSRPDQHTLGVGVLTRKLAEALATGTPDRGPPAIPKGLQQIRLAVGAFEGSDGRAGLAPDLIGSGQKPDTIVAEILQELDTAAARIDAGDLSKDRWRSTQLLTANGYQRLVAENAVWRGEVASNPTAIEDARSRAAARLAQMRENDA